MTKALFKSEHINTLPSNIEKIRSVMAALRDPKHGCPWDLEQNFETIAPFSIEEAYEVRDAIQAGDMNAFREELGDLLLQVIYQSQLAEEENLFNFDDVAQTITDKMIRRHPHVFETADANTNPERSVEMQKGAWEKQKAKERQAKSETSTPSAMDDIVSSLPALMKAQKIQNRAARVGFDWPNTDGVYDKIDEEILEIQQATTPLEIEDEVGDLLFTAVNLARKLSVDPEEALRKANSKFEKRFRAMEAKGHQLSEMDLIQLETVWQQAKAETSK